MTGFSFAGRNGKGKGFQPERLKIHIYFVFVLFVP